MREPRDCGVNLGLRTRERWRTHRFRVAESEYGIDRPFLGLSLAPALEDSGVRSEAKIDRVERVSPSTRLSGVFCPGRMQRKQAQQASRDKDRFIATLNTVQQGPHR